MVAYVILRTLRAVMQLLAASFLTFALVGAAPGGFLDDLRLDPRVSADTVQALTREYGLDRPLAVRYGEWLAGVAQGQLGYSLTYRVPVEQLLVPRLIDTLLLASSALGAAWALALGLGLVTTIAARGWHRHAVDGIVAALLAIPELLLVMLLLVFAMRVGWPSGTRAAQLALPVAALALSATPFLVHHVRHALRHALSPALDIALDARGVSRRHRVTRHALRLAGAPLAALAGLSLGTLLSTSLLVEVLVGWPGVGPLMLEAVLARDDYIVVAVATASSALVLVANALADIGAALVDPRSRGRA